MKLLDYFNTGVNDSIKARAWKTNKSKKNK